VAVVLYTSVSIGLFLERRPKALWLQWGKQFAFALAALILPLPIELSSGLVVSAAISAALLCCVRDNYALPIGSKTDQREATV
jgi:hypothetical protein